MVDTVGSHRCFTPSVHAISRQTGQGRGPRPALPPPRGRGSGKWPSRSTTRTARRAGPPRVLRVLPTPLSKALQACSQSRAGSPGSGPGRGLGPGAQGDSPTRMATSRARGGCLRTRRRQWIIYPRYVPWIIYDPRCVPTLRRRQPGGSSGRRLAAVSFLRVFRALACGTGWLSESVGDTAASLARTVGADIRHGIPGVILHCLTWGAGGFRRSL